MPKQHVYNNNKKIFIGYSGRNNLSISSTKMRETKKQMPKMSTIKARTWTRAKCSSFFIPPMLCVSSIDKLSFEN